MSKEMRPTHQETIGVLQELVEVFSIQEPFAFQEGIRLHDKLTIHPKDGRIHAVELYRDGWLERQDRARSDLRCVVKDGELYEADRRDSDGTFYSLWGEKLARRGRIALFGAADMALRFHSTE